MIVQPGEQRSLSSRGANERPLQLDPVQIPNSAMKVTSKYAGSPNKFIGKATPSRGKLRASGSLSTIQAPHDVYSRPLAGPKEYFATNNPQRKSQQGPRLPPAVKQSQNLQA